MNVFLVGLGRTTTITIDPTSTVLELKRKCKEKMKVEIEQHRLIFAGKQLEDYQTLGFYKIGNGSTIHLVVRLSGGGGFNFAPFQDLSKPTLAKSWNTDAPSWRNAVNGLNIEGYCKNYSCKASGRRVIVQWGYNDFDFFQDEHKSRCPLCEQYVTPTTCGFTNTFWKFQGSKKVDGKPPEKIDSDWKFAPSDKYTTFEGEDLVIWMNLVIKVRRP
ncbi:hypothetical protein RclHR1_02720020 [Rhizophagus clarus]|uniref:Ubiquitin-like domain-containing protein n=1 Tax=Rhizophagus clarus TaxID=94130 RepID=A0A2Z6R2W2_9GLOM|nr:hypothetical protein RclHR1_02720020 [Rhizophagus clarus]